MSYFIGSNANATDEEERQYINDGIVQYYCDAKKSNFYFDADSPTSPLIDVKKQKVDVNSLLLLTKEDSQGNMTRLGSKKATRQCGAIKVVFESGYYNANPQGLLGLMDYPLVSISINGKNLFNKTPLNLCASGGLRAVCPTALSIQEIKITKISPDLYQVKLTKALPVDEGDSFKLKKEILKIKIK